MSKSKEGRKRTASSLEARFPNEWKVVRRLTELKHVDPELLESAIGPIVAKYRPIIHLRHNLKGALGAAGVASVAVKEIQSTVRQLGPSYRKALSAMIKVACRAQLSKDQFDPTSITPMLEGISLQLTLIKMVLMFGTSALGPDSAEPADDYKSAALELLAKWKELVPAAVKIPYPRLKLGHNAHGSTEFVYQCLKMIEPTIQASRARTAVQRAIEGWDQWQRTRAAAKKRFGADTEAALVKFNKTMIALQARNARKRNAPSATIKI